MGWDGMGWEPHHGAEVRHDRGRQHQVHGVAIAEESHLPRNQHVARLGRLHTYTHLDVEKTDTTTSHALIHTHRQVHTIHTFIHTYIHTVR